MISILKILIYVVCIVMIVSVFVYKSSTGLKASRNEIIGVVLGSLLTMTVVASIHSVPANHVGIRYSYIEGTSSKTLGEGMHFLVPFVDKLICIDTKVQESYITNISVQTKDAQYLKVDFDVKFKVNKTDANKVYAAYGGIDNLKSSIISNYGQKAIELVVTQYNIIEVLGDKKADVYAEVEELLKGMLEEESVTLTNLTIIDMDAGELIESAIQAEAVAKKEVETAEQNRLKAEKDAETAIIEATAEAEVNRLLNQEMSDEILSKLFIEKWDGKLPVIYGSDGNILDVSTFFSE